MVLISCSKSLVSRHFLLSDIKETTAADNFRGGCRAFWVRLFDCLLQVIVCNMGNRVNDTPIVGFMGNRVNCG